MQIKNALTTMALATVLLTSSISANELLDEFMSTSYSYNKNGYSFGVKYLRQGQNVFMTKLRSDIDRWVWGKSDSPFKDNLMINPVRYTDKELCLNAHNPRKGSNVNVYQCDPDDTEQHWQEINNGKYKMIQLMGKNLCLNSYRTRQGSNLNLWTCDRNDPDQQFRRFQSLTYPLD